MVWPFLMGGSALLLAASSVVGSGWAARSSLVIFAGLLAVRAKNFLFMGSDLSFVVGASIWVICAVAIPRQVVYNGRQVMAPSSQISLLLVSVGLCSMWARVVNAPRVFGSLPYVVADLLLVAAMLVIGWQIRDDIIGRIRSLGYRYSGICRRGFDSVSTLSDKGLSQEEVSRNVR